MKKNPYILIFFMVALFSLTIEHHLKAGRGGAVAGGVLGGLAVGTIIGSAASRNAYASNEEYIRALEQENADLRAELRLVRRRDSRTYAR